MLPWDGDCCFLPSPSVGSLNVAGPRLGNHCWFFSSELSRSRGWSGLEERNVPGRCCGACAASSVQPVAFWDSCCLSCPKFLWHISPGLASLGSVTSWMCCLSNSLFSPLGTHEVVSAASSPLCPTRALGAALSEAKRLLQPFKSCCPFFRMHYLFLFLGVLVFCLGSGHSPNLCRNPILKLVQLLTYHRQLCSSCDGSESFCMWRGLC